jgi:hypothetical protein
LIDIGRSSVFKKPLGKVSVGFNAIIIVAMALVIILKIRDGGDLTYIHNLPHVYVFYISIVLGYFILPISELVIFRRVWGVKASAISAFLKKRIANEFILGYSGEVYLYTWARSQHPRINTAFDAVKDVSITSALMGNCMTLLLLGLVWPLADRVGAGHLAWPVFSSALAIFAISALPIILKRHLFSLPAATLRWIASVHATRLAAGIVLIGISWWSGLPGASMPMCLLLVTARILLGRMPFIPNREMLFATVVLLMVDGMQPVTLVASAIALVNLALDGVILAGLALHDVQRNVVTRYGRGLLWQSFRSGHAYHHDRSPLLLIDRPTESV